MQQQGNDNSVCQAARQMIHDKHRKDRHDEETPFSPFDQVHLMCFSNSNSQKNVDERIQLKHPDKHHIKVICMDCSAPLPEGLDEAGTKASKMLQERQQSGMIRGRAFYAFPPPSVTLCTNQLQSTESVHDALRHEASHASDQGVLGMDLNYCGVLACSEIRASTFAECRRKALTSLQRTCVNTQASNSTTMVFPEYGSQCVRDVWNRCFGSSKHVNPVTDLQEQATAQRQET